MRGRKKLARNRRYALTSAGGASAMPGPRSMSANLAWRDPVKCLDAMAATTASSTTKVLSRATHDSLIDLSSRSYKSSHTYMTLWRAAGHKAWRVSRRAVAHDSWDDYARALGLNLLKARERRGLSQERL